MSGLVRSQASRDGAWQRLQLNAPPGNLLSLDLVRALGKALHDLQSTPGIKWLTIEGAGDEFSFGAKIQEHEPGLMATVLPETHRVIRQVLADGWCHHIERLMVLGNFMLLCRIRPGRAGACDRYANEEGRLVRVDPLVLLAKPDTARVAFVEGSPAWRGELGKGEDAFVTGIGATTTYPDYKPAPFIVSSKHDGVDMVTVVTEGIFSYCGVKVKIDTDRFLGPEQAAVRVKGEAVGHVTTAEYGSQMLSLGGVHHLTGGSKKEGIDTCDALLALCNRGAVELSIDGGATVVVQSEKPPVVNGSVEERMRVGCGSAAIGMFAPQWHGHVDEVIVVDDHITGVLSEHQGGAFLDMKPAGIRVRGRRSIRLKSQHRDAVRAVDPLLVLEGLVHHGQRDAQQVVLDKSAVEEEVEQAADLLSSDPAPGARGSARGGAQRLYARGGLDSLRHRCLSEHRPGAWRGMVKGESGILARGRALPALLEQLVQVEDGHAHVTLNAHVEIEREQFRRRSRGRALGRWRHAHGRRPIRHVARAGARAVWRFAPVVREYRVARVLMRPLL